MEDGDVISRLPGDLLISILSRLTLKEAIVTSVLSRRWEKLWAFYHGNLDFEVSRTLRQRGCSNYLRTVNKVLDTLEGGGVFDSFTIRFDLCPNNLSSVDRWVQFALEKRRVKRLVIEHFLFSYGCLHCGIDFPPLQCFYAQNRNIQALTSIHFQLVNVSGEILEHFLSNCPLLQSLEILLSGDALIHLRVSGETLALRQLAIRGCHFLNTIEISAPNLVSFIYCGSVRTKFDVRNAPKLVEFSFDVLGSPASTVSALCRLRCFSHIQKLEFHIHSKEPEDFMKLIEFTSLKHFTMRVSEYECSRILAWTPLLKAFPVLQKFTLDMRSRREKGIDRVTKDHSMFPSQCLKVFEFLGFGKSDGDIELVMYFLKNMTVPLEKIILGCESGAAPLALPTVVKAVRVAAKLKQIIPKEINLVLLSPLIDSWFLQHMKK